MVSDTLRQPSPIPPKVIPVSGSGRNHGGMVHISHGMQSAMLPERESRYGREVRLGCVRNVVNRS
jgi:hypothetical protein